MLFFKYPDIFSKKVPGDEKTPTGGTQGGDPDAVSVGLPFLDRLSAPWYNVCSEEVNTMSIVIELPPQIEQHLATSWRELPRKALEAVEGYRQEVLTRGQVGEMLGMSFWETEAFLKEHAAYLHFDQEDYESDGQTLVQG